MAYVIMFIRVEDGNRRGSVHRYPRLAEWVDLLVPLNGPNNSLDTKLWWSEPLTLTAAI